MNKNIKRIIATTLIVSAFCTVLPVNYSNLNFIAQTAYAAEFRNNSISLSLNKPFFIDGSLAQDEYVVLNQSISDKTSYSVTVSKSLGMVTIKCGVNENNAKVIIDGQIVTENSEKKKNYEKQVTLGKDKNVFDIKIKSKNGMLKNYKAIIYQNDDLKLDNINEIYLENIILNNGNIKLDFDKSEDSAKYYNIDVDDFIKEILVKVQPENKKDIVRINGVITDSSFERIVYLDSGINDIIIEVEDSKNSNCKNTYVLTTVPKYNQWVYKDNNMYRYDSNGQIITNMWYLEKGNSDEYWYYLSTNGAATKDWLYNKGKWYHFNAKNVMEKKWKYINGIWYYFDLSGAMKTGWLNDNGTWYYMQSSGAMKTGWLNDNGIWYYMQPSGKMKTGWLQDYDQTWYYLNTNGAMATNTNINEYSLASNGAWIK